MIILKHLTVERFRLLRELNLHFPQRGSILIQGPNEAGKSALLESIYFGLYGEPMTPAHRNINPLDDLILYGATNATVTLTLSIGATELVIMRTIERGQGQSVLLKIRHLGMPDEEPVTNLIEANRRIVSELGYMDGETLRNSCLIEQKGLARLEALQGTQRDAAARKLLGLEHLAQLTERFTLHPTDEDALTEANKYLRLAEIQQRIPEVSKQLENIEIALDAVTVREKLDEINLQREDIAEQQQEQDHIKERRQILKSRSSRAQQLKKADATLEEIITSYDEIAEARREIPEIEWQIEELEHREQEELPVLQKRVNELAELTQSFGTLQRMSNDLLTAVETVKDREEELKRYESIQDDLKNFEDQVAQARARLQQAKQSLNELQEQRRSGRPLIEGRLGRMQNLAEKLQELRRLEERYAHRVAGRPQEEENKRQLASITTDLRDVEHELALVEAEAKQVKQRADTADQRWRQLSIRRHMEEWHRLMGLAQGLRQAEQRVQMAGQQMGVINQAKMDAHHKASTITLVGVGATIVGVIAIILGIALFVAGNAVGGWALLLVALLAGVFAYYNYHNAGKAREAEASADVQLQEATNHFSMTVAAREAAVRMSGDQQALEQLEHEIRSLGGSIPQSLDEAQRILEQTPDNNESLAELQQKMQEKRDEANAAQSQVNVTMEAVATLRKERASLEALRKKEDWDHLEENLLADRNALTQMHQEITLLAGQEGMPTPSINARLRSSADFETYVSGQLSPVQTDEEAGVPVLETLVESSIKVAERELAALDGKLDLVADLENQARIHQEALDVQLTRQHAVEERYLSYQAKNPVLQVERAREQQIVLSQALQSLRESLHQRVKPLGVSFGQAAIGSAEASARKQLESLQISLGSKLVLQEKADNYAENLKNRQEALSDLYKQLAKYSNTLGSWIVPLNPFAEALVSLRTRCQNELQEANEGGIQKEMETLESQEGASKAKIELCHQEIEDAQVHITALLAQRQRPAAKGYALADLQAVWPLIATYTAPDRQHLEEEQATLEKELADLEAQELELSKELNTGEAQLDLAEMQARKDEQERIYLVKKHSKSLIEAVDERLLRKILPRTEHHMQQILPLLTSGRYHDVHLTTEDDAATTTSGPFQVEVWDSSAGAYIHKSVLSGGASDQLSLALRLGFAIAALPRELSVAPGFVVLDEPLSSFDRGRAQALVNVVTGDVLCQHFEQIILISHSSAFDPAMFPYHLYLDNGLIVESNLPIVLEQPVGVSLPDDIRPIELEEMPVDLPAMEDEDEDMMTVHVPAITSYAGKSKE